ncbi:uncharacterized protein C3F10.06c isoform X2 [Cucumis melo]|uniref:Uncharacterized protein C3F10.06c isoform X2 n=1 Tax=Cucumis melo TaxID=3656 RepID=A0ABM3KSU2_CUCME|nr:uncharacterized protein C3F10.06c isoform X2 [Cucumis melo]
MWRNWLKGGCIIVDSTRRGKRFPDSMSKTIPIWTCVLNRSISKHLKKIHGSSSELGEPSTSAVLAENGKECTVGWDCSLHLPLWVSETEKAAIEERLEEWTKQLDDCGADVTTLASILRKPLRPLWISQRSVIWLNEVPDHDSWDFTPIILVTASFSTGVVQQRTTTEFSWNYISGAGDDEESWARGLTPNLFWNHAHDLMSSGPDICNQKVAEIVEKDRVYRALRGNDAPQISVKSRKGSSTQVPPIEQMLSFDISDAELDAKSSDGNCGLSWLGSTRLAVGSSQNAVTASNVDCILNCDQESLSVCLPVASAYLHLPMMMSKLDRFSLSRNLASAVDFAKLNLNQGKRLLVCCSNGEDISICVCLAILTSLFDDEGTFDCGKSFDNTHITKLEMRRRLVYICKFATNARPSRGNLRQVFNFLSGGRTD